jgi:hypothetical protein
MKPSTYRSARRSKSFLGATATLLCSAGAFATIFASTSIVQGLMNGGPRNAVSQGVLLAFLGGTVGLAVGMAILTTSRCCATLTLCTLARMLIAGLLVGALASVAGAFVSQAIGDGAFAAFPPTILGLSGTIVGICGAGTYLAEQKGAEVEDWLDDASLTSTERAPIAAPPQLAAHSAKSLAEPARTPHVEVTTDLAAWTVA